MAERKKEKGRQHQAPVGLTLRARACHCVAAISSIGRAVAIETSHPPPVQSQSAGRRAFGRKLVRLPATIEVFMGINYYVR